MVNHANKTAVHVEKTKFNLTKVVETNELELSVRAHIDWNRWNLIESVSTAKLMSAVQKLYSRNK